MSNWSEAIMRAGVVCIVVGITAVASGTPSVRFVARWGGTTKDLGQTIVLDDANGLFVTGSTYSPDFPTTTTGIPNGHWCAFTTKLRAPSGAGLYSTVLCGKGVTWGWAAALAPAGELWIAGSSDGPGLPVTADAVQRRFGGYAIPSGSGDAFVARWSADGRTVRYATYLGGRGDDRAAALLADQDGGVWLAGNTTSANFPVSVDAVQSRQAGGEDAFLAHLDGRGRLVFSTYLGGSGNDEITALARLDRDRIVVAGNTSSPDGAFGGPARGRTDAFVGVFDAFTRTIGWWRRLGGAGDDHVRSVAVLHDRTVIAVGDSESAGCHRASRRHAAWVVALSESGDVKADYCLDGVHFGDARGVAAAADGTVWVTGVALSKRIVTGPGNQRPDPYDQAFVARLDPLRGAVRSVTLLSAEISRGSAVSVGRDGVVYATGETTAPPRTLNQSLGLLQPTEGAFREGQRLGSTDAYVVALR